MEAVKEKPRLQKYPAYKYSGAEWLGEVPEIWKVLKVKNIFRLVAEPAPVNNTLELLSVYTEIGVKPRKELEERGNKASTTDGYWLVKKGDVIVNKLLAWMGAIGVSNYNGVTSPAYDILRPKIPVDSKFYHYLFRNPSCISELKKHSRGIMEMRLRLYFDKFGDILISYPDLEQQKEIVHFLNKKCGKIDTAIVQKQKLIELLKERKQIIIQNAVTKGLDPEVKMKDSGVEWIGEIPEHWEVKKLKFLLRIRNGEDYKNVLAESGYPVIGSGGQFAYASKYLYDGEALLLGRKGTIDKPLYINGKFWTVDTMFYAIVTKNYSTEYLFYLAKTIPFKLYSTSTALPSMTQNDLNNHKVAIPSLREQKDIIKHIKLRLTEIDKAIALQQQQIEKLKEYKSSLIDAAVTGKIKVV